MGNLLQWVWYESASKRVSQFAFTAPNQATERRYLANDHPNVSVLSHLAISRL